jgi:hypothetical protein
MPTATSPVTVPIACEPVTSPRLYAPIWSIDEKTPLTMPPTALPPATLPMTCREVLDKAVVPNLPRASSTLLPIILSPAALNAPTVVPTPVLVTRVVVAPR